MRITGVGPGPHVCWAIRPKATVRIQAVLQCIIGRGNTKWYKQCELRIKWQIDGKTHLMEGRCALSAIYESTDASGTGTFLITTFANRKSCKYEHMCREDMRQVGKGGKKISCLSFVGSAEVSGPALRHAQHKAFAHKQK